MLGLVGCGSIGQEIARRARAFEMAVAAHDPYLDPNVAEQQGIRLLPLDEIVRTADFLVMAAKVTDETRGMISDTLIRTMKPSAFLINTARADLVDYGALHRALSEKRIAGAAIDVYPREPISESDPFRSLDNVVLSPHLAGASTDVSRHHSAMLVDDLLRAFQGERPRCLVNPGAWESSRFLKSWSNGET
jgi:D-3-phosphoglycerate dehydrogenase